MPVGWHFVPCLTIDRSTTAGTHGPRPGWHLGLHVAWPPVKQAPRKTLDTPTVADVRLPFLVVAVSQLVVHGSSLP